MSDQLFIGRSPKSPIGKEIMFHSLDQWMELWGCMTALIEGDIPPFPSLDEKATEAIADILDSCLGSGLVQDHYLLVFTEREEEECSDLEVVPDRLLAPSQEVCANVEFMVDLTRKYVAFLRDCGGCDPEQ